MVSTVDVALDRWSLNVVRARRAELEQVLRSKFNCQLTVSDQHWDGGGAAAASRRFEMTLRSGVKVSVCKADLTRFPVDAVVNAANESLQHGGGLAYALARAGGPRIQQESTDYVRAHGPVATGSAVMMDAGLLPCRKIVHAVGPRLLGSISAGDLDAARRLLSQAVGSVIDLVEKEGLRTVAIPAISSGIFNFPLRPCAETIVKALSCARHLKEIHLVNNDEPTVRAMESACREELEKFRHTRGAPARIEAERRASGAHFGKVRVTVKRGSIKDEQTDVIVNTMSRTRWARGSIFKAIVQKAGLEMERELKNVRSDDLVVTTGAYDLRCKQVYHIQWPDHCHCDKYLDTLRVAVLHCLQMASGSHRSISFPAIGTGNPELLKRDVANVMLRAVTEFAAEQDRRLDLYFVIPSHEDDTLKVFQEELGRAQQMAPRGNVLHDQGRRDVSSPHIRLTSTSDEAQQEAQRWFSQLLLDSSTLCVSVCNHFILHLGEAEQLQLRQLARGGVGVEEWFGCGQAGLTLQGSSPDHVAAAALQVEAVLCRAVDQFVRQEERLLSAEAEQLHFSRTALHPADCDRLEAVGALRRMGLNTVKVETVLNSTMRRSFHHLQDRLDCSAPRTMFQCVPAHFCDVVCRVGFNAECSPPDEPNHGEGIYFAATVQKALEVWKLPNQEYLYMVEATVLTGNPTAGRPGLIVPPLLDSSPDRRHHSVSAGPDVSVIFDGRQALPTKIFTCKLRESPSSFSSAC